MPFAQETLDHFLSTYEQNTVNPDPDVVVTQFADTFIAGGPSGAMVVPAALFAERLPARKRRFQEAGLQSTELRARRDRRIGDRYVLVETEWTMNFVPEGKPATSLTVTSSFLIDMGGSEPRILAYLAHQDIFQMMQERMLLPPH